MRNEELINYLHARIEALEKELEFKNQQLNILNN